MTQPAESGLARPKDLEAPKAEAELRDLDSALRMIFVTMLRPDCARRFVESVRGFHPRMPISFAEQTDGEGDLADLDGAARRIRVPFDIGLAASRNRLIETIDEEFFLLADDDFFAPAPLQLGVVQRFIRENPDVVFVGGHVTDYYFSEDREPRCVDDRRDSNLAVDTTGRGVVLIPRAYVGGEDRIFEDKVFERCDYVANWGVGRTSFFKESGFRWSEELKVGHEHIDFFLRLKLQHPDKRVFFCPDLKIDHHRRRDASEDYMSYRKRDEFIELYGQISQLDYMCDPVIGRVQFFRDFRTQIMFPRPDRERANRDRQRLLEIRERYLQLKTKYAELKDSHNSLKEKISAKKAQKQTTS